MQRSEIISAEDIPALLEAVYSEEVTVYETYSEYDRQALIFENREAAQAHIDNRLSDYSGTIQLSLRYPSMVGTIDINRITIKPGSSDIRHIRYNIRGWGLIAFHIKITKRKEIECWISSNSQKRAVTWSDTYRDLGDPNLWDWKAVEKHTRRLIRVLRKTAGTLK